MGKAHKHRFPPRKASHQTISPSEADPAIGRALAGDKPGSLYVMDTTMKTPHRIGVRREW